MMSILMLLGVCLHLSWEISVVEDETRTLAEEVAILRSQVEALSAPQPSDPVSRGRSTHGNSSISPVVAVEPSTESAES
jgi:hypothetical protein